MFTHFVFIFVAYGSTIMDKEKHRTINYVKGECKARWEINKPNFRKMTPLDDDTYEIELNKKSITMNVHISIGFFILQLAKLR